MFPMKEEGCMAHMMQPEDVTFCEAIQQLYDEHPPLREQMNQLLDKSAAIVEEEPNHYLASLQELCNLEQVFKKELLIHSEKEENGLFPMVGKYIGTQAGPIAVMEHEHSEGKRNLDEFESRADGNLSGEITLKTVQQTIEPLMEACHILLNHFMKEENVLFPMAEQLLNGQEKEDLLKIVKPAL